MIKKTNTFCAQNIKKSPQTERKGMLDQWRGNKSGRNCWVNSSLLC